VFLLSCFCRYSFTIWVEVLDIPTIIPYFPSVCRKGMQRSVSWLYWEIL
jgi:hypothetical protein